MLFVWISVDSCSFLTVPLRNQKKNEARAIADFVLAIYSK